jgi:hypothetical protein
VSHAKGFHGITSKIVSIFSNYILKDPADPDAMKVHIGRVQISMGKVARFDKAVFSKRRT